jgi:hypothetical protein
MRVCPECHAVVRETASFCDRCGRRLESPPAEAKAASPVTPQASTEGVAPGTCSSCGYLNVPGEMFCQNCGVQLAPIASAPPPPPVQVSLQKGPVAPARPHDRCQVCASPRGPGDVFCQNCGARLPTAAPEPDRPASQPAAPVTVEERLEAVIKLVVSASKVEILLDMDRTEWLVGRSDPLRGIFPEVDLGPHGGDKSGVSRRHAKLVTQAGGRWILDLNSTNFTFLNGDQLRPGELYPLKHGDEIRFGLLVLEFFEEIAQ